jgi:hypothetical protein
MNTSPRIEREFEFEASALKTTFRTLGRVLRIPLLGVLMLLEPFVRYVFGAAMVLGVLASIAFEVSAVGPRFPFLAMLGLSLGFGVALFLYYGLVSLLSD